MRELFISERRYIHNVLRKHAIASLEASDIVVAEYYAPARTSSRTRFNNDFSLHLVPMDRIDRFKSCCAGILPNTIGVDVFVTIDDHTGKPLMTELLGGEALPITYYDEHIEKVEMQLSLLSRPIRFRKTLYCRVFVIENDICFLAFPNHSTPVVRGRHEILYTSSESSIGCSMEGGDVVYVDGWIRTNIVESEVLLEAISVI